jgi:hypothetical protein
MYVYTTTHIDTIAPIDIHILDIYRYMHLSSSIYMYEMIHMECSRALAPLPLRTHAHAHAC